MEPSSMPKVNPDCLHSKIIYEKKGAFMVTYSEYYAPWPVANRDFVLLHHIHREGNKIYLLAQSCDYPYPEVNGIVRG